MALHCLPFSSLSSLFSDAPLFAGNLRNASLLTEIATGHNRSLTGTVVDYSGPDPLSLTLTNHIPPSMYNQTNTSSITLTITNASDSDAVDYTFLACTGKQPKYCSYLSFPTYVGGKALALHPAGHGGWATLHVHVHVCSPFSLASTDNILSLYSASQP